MIRSVPFHRNVDWRAFRALLRRVVDAGGMRSGAMYGIMALGLLLPLFDLARPWPLKWIIDAVVGAEQAPLTASRIGVLAGLLAGIVVLRSWVGYVHASRLESIGRTATFQLRCDLFAKLQCLSQDFHSRAQVGDILMRLTGDLRLVGEMLTAALTTVSTSVFWCIGAVGIMVWLDPILASAILLALPLMAAVSVVLTGRLRRAVHEQRRKEAALSATVEESLYGMRLIHAYGRQRSMTNRFAKRGSKSLHASLKARRLQILLEAALVSIVAAVAAAVIWLGVHRVLAGHLSAGELVVLVMYAEALYRPVRNLSRFMSRLSKAVACGARVTDILDRQPTVHDLPSASAEPIAVGEIRFDAVTFTYPKATEPAVEGIDLTIAPGSLVALVGNSGAGKTTLLNLLLRFYDCDSGRVVVDGRDVRDYRLSALRAQCSVVLQEPFLAQATIHDNIAFGVDSAARDAVERAARRVDIGGWIDSLPDGYDTVVGDGGVSLSGGQQQLIAVARALLRESRLVVMDEPARALDAEAEAALASVIGGVLSNRTRIVIAHRFRTILAADQIVMMRRGRIIDVGSHEQLLRSCERYSRLCALQFSLDPSAATVGLAERLDVRTSC